MNASIPINCSHNVCDRTCDFIKKDTFTSTQNHEYRMISEKTKQEEEHTKQMQCEIELLKLRIQLEELRRK